MFKNHFIIPESNSSINLSISRILLSFYLIWKILSERWNRVLTYPITDNRPSIIYLEPLVPSAVIQNVELLQYITIFFLIILIFGIHVRFSAYLSSVLVCYMGIIRYFYDTGWSTQSMFVASIFLMLFALYAEQDSLTYNKLRGSSESVIIEIKKQLNANAPLDERSTPLSIFLIGMGAMYFGSGIGKLAEGTGLSWISPVNLGRHIERSGGGYVYQYAGFLMQSDLILFIAALFTIIFEIGFFISIFVSTKILFNLIISGLLLMHIGIALFMGPVFIYNIVFLLLFFDWERLTPILMRRI